MVWRTSVEIRRRASGVTIGPRRMRSVAAATAATAASMVQTSAIAVTSAGSRWTWSHRNTPVPARALGRPCHLDEGAGVGHLGEGRDVEGVTHGGTLPTGP